MHVSMLCPAATQVELSALYSLGEPQATVTLEEEEVICLGWQSVESTRLGLEPALPVPRFPAPSCGQSMFYALSLPQ